MALVPMLCVTAVQEYAIHLLIATAVSHAVCNSGAGMRCTPTHCNSCIPCCL